MSQRVSSRHYRTGLVGVASLPPYMRRKRSCSLKEFEGDLGSFRARFLAPSRPTVLQALYSVLVTAGQPCVPIHPLAQPKNKEK
ncbi:hypothetical protein NHX12_014581 [Muraenolepis orangiensis]|uniref:Uncharacterized protein n=1 Tax=Muraenolepis orangiensis TaxID=630683 RepID=A0A9Q0D8U1_9TELE|nr:hypothetical protein NHX12_014581 [Muraenolepis orangiensis]